MEKLYRAGKIVLDVAKHSLVVGSTQIDVDPKPFEIIRFLAVNADRMVSNQEVTTAVWGGNVKDETYRVTLSNANSKFKEALRTAYSGVSPKPFYSRPKANYLQWAAGEVEDITPAVAILPEPVPRLIKPQGP